MANQQLQTMRPHPNTISNLADRINQNLFHRKYDNKIVKYNSADIIKLLNRVSQKPEIPQELKHNWGDAIISAPSMKACFDKFGIRGNKLQQQNKEAIGSSMMVLDNNNNVMNTNYLKWMIPQTSNPGKNSFIEKCKQIRVNFDTNNSNILCNAETLRRMS